MCRSKDQVLVNTTANKSEKLLQCLQASSLKFLDLQGGQMWVNSHVLDNKQVGLFWIYTCWKLIFLYTNRKILDQEATPSKILFLENLNQWELLCITWRKNMAYLLPDTTYHEPGSVCLCKVMYIIATLLPPFDNILHSMFCTTQWFKIATHAWRKQVTQNMNN